jgi:HD-GYP domain-containing protein (c-di-GMP phosphodiesterase class II)
MDDREEQVLLRHSKDLVNQFAVIIKTSQIHDPSNVAVQTAMKKFVELVSGLTATGTSVTLELVGEYFYINEARVKVAMEYLVNFDYLVREFKKHMLGSITFTGRVMMEDVHAFLKSFIASAFSEDPFAELEEGMESVGSIKVGAPRRIKEQEGEADVRKTVKKTYFNAVSFSKGVLNKIKAGEKVNIRRSKRIVQSMVDTLLKEEDLLVGMTAIKDYDDYTYHHSVNVSILCISIGQKLGFSRQALLELGLVALFHDVGKTEIPIEILNKPSSFTDEEWETVRKHPYWGVRTILDMKGLDSVSMRAAIVAFEHHLHLDYSGYPTTRFRHEPDLYSKIVSIADQYDAMTSSRVYSRAPMSPDKALSVMMERSGTELDPLLMKFFVNMMGVYPVGTAVMLDTRELGLVHSNNMMFPDRPKVLVITDPNGNKVKSYTVDLTEKIPAGQYKRSIQKTMDPQKYRISLAEHLL